MKAKCPACGFIWYLDFSDEVTCPNCKAKELGNLFCLSCDGNSFEVDHKDHLYLVKGV